MPRINRPVTSREYKLMLAVDRFRDQNEGAREFWQLVEFLAQRQRVRVDGDEELASVEVEDQVDEAVEKRNVYYLDTQGLAFRRNGFILRVREEPDKAESERFKITLKYRAADRYVSAFQDLDVPRDQQDGRVVESKFEEDVIPPFTSKFSQSTAIKQAAGPRINDVKDVLKLFPGLKDLEIPKGLPVEIVKNFTAYEVFRKAGKIKFGKGPKVKAALSFWYLRKKRDGRPVTAEFSFDYDCSKPEDNDSAEQLEQFPAHIVEGSNGLFQSLQKQSGWVNFASTTKTAYAYDAL